MLGDFSRPMKNTALKVAGTVFLVISLLHLSRVILRFSAVVEGHEIPFFANAVAFVTMLALAIWMFRASK